MLWILSATCLLNFADKFTSHRRQFSATDLWNEPTPQQTIEPLPALGIDYLPDEVLRRIKKRTFAFNLMCVGSSDLGKTTFINTLFHTDLVPDLDATIQAEADAPLEQIQPYMALVEEDGVQLQLTALDTPSLEQSSGKCQVLAMVEGYIDAQYRQYMLAEHALRRPAQLPDTRVHAILYFIPTTKGRLREADLATLQRLCRKANVIPVIAKADTYTSVEIQQLKARFLDEVDKHEIDIYQPRPGDDLECLELLARHAPFAIIGSTSVHPWNGAMVRGRQYPWGLVQVENPDHCDVVHLRRYVMEICLHDLINSTHDTHYAHYRVQLMRKNGRPESLMPLDDGFDLKLTSTQRRVVHIMQKREEEVRVAFMARIQEKEAELRQREEDLKQVREKLSAELEEEQQALHAELASLPPEPHTGARSKPGFHLSLGKSFSFR
ncbi:Septin-6 [Dimargaris verticillata]|uniref:Septin-6 n=1 Tax=Dimargaris verticillata TaxID=2761393 RepID=A0A9W8B244_9FUNG|nr:Septin-6 [Dimargaris verticillata]